MWWSLQWTEKGIRLKFVLLICTSFKLHYKPLSLLHSIPSGTSHPPQSSSKHIFCLRKPPLTYALEQILWVGQEVLCCQTEKNQVKYFARINMHVDNYIPSQLR